VKRAAALAIAVIAYSLAAWMVAPGFYDGFGPPQPYNFTCPPPQAGANIKPSSGHADIPVRVGVSEADSAFTDDGQLVMGFLPGAFVVGGKTTITVEIKPLDTCPQPAGLRLVTNAYHVTASAALNPSKPANLVLRYSNLEPDPAEIYQASDPGGPWTALPSQPGQPFTIVTKQGTATFGYFAAGYKSSSPPPGSVTVGGGQILPILVAVLIVVVVLAGLPLAIMRRRQSGDRED